MSYSDEEYYESLMLSEVLARSGRINAYDRLQTSEDFKEKPSLSSSNVEVVTSTIKELASGRERVSNQESYPKFSKKHSKYDSKHE